MKLAPSLLALAVLALPASADPPGPGPAGPVRPAIEDAALLAELTEAAPDNPGIQLTYNLLGRDFNAGLVSSHIRDLCAPGRIRDLNADTQGDSCRGWWAVVRRGGQAYYASRDSLTPIPAGYTPEADGGQLVARKGSAERPPQDIIRFSPQGTLHSTARFNYSEGDSPTLTSAVVSGPATLADMLGLAPLRGLAEGLQGVRMQVRTGDRTEAMDLRAAIQRFLSAPGATVSVSFEQAGENRVARIRLQQGRERVGSLQFVLTASGPATFRHDDPDSPPQFPTGWTRSTGEG